MLDNERTILYFLFDSRANLGLLKSTFEDAMSVKFLLAIVLVLGIWMGSNAAAQQTRSTRKVSYKDLSALSQKPGSGVTRYIKIKAADIPSKIVDGKRTISYLDIQAFAKQSGQISPDRSQCSGTKTICCPCDNDILCVVEIPDNCTTTCSANVIVISCPTCPSYNVSCGIQ